MKKIFYLAFLFLGMFCFLPATHAAIVSEIEPNNTFATAQDLSPSWTLPGMPNSVRNGGSYWQYWSLIQATGDGTTDYYSLSLTTTTQLQIDVDNSNSDLTLALWFDSGSGFEISGYVMGFNSIDAGGNSTNEPFWSYGGFGAGTLIIGITGGTPNVNGTGFISASGVLSGTSYDLGIATYNGTGTPPYTSSVPVPSTFFLLATGLLGVTRFSRKK